MPLQIGISGVARNIKDIEIGAGGTARKVIGGWVGIGGYAKRFFGNPYYTAVLTNENNWKIVRDGTLTDTSIANTWGRVFIDITNTYLICSRYSDGNKIYLLNLQTSQSTLLKSSFQTGGFYADRNCEYIFMLPPQGTGNDIHVYKRSGMTLTETAIVPVSGTALYLTASADGNFIAVGRSDDTQLFQRSGDTVNYIGSTPLLGNNDFMPALSADGTYFAGQQNGTLVIYKRSGTAFSQLSMPQGVLSQAMSSTSFNSSGQYLATAWANGFQLFRIQSDTVTLIQDVSDNTRSQFFTRFMYNDYLAVGSSDSSGSRIIFYETAGNSLIEKNRWTSSSFNYRDIAPAP